MELLKLRKAAQLTLPLHLRKAFGLKDGDYLEVEVVEEGILLKPVTVVERKTAWENVSRPTSGNILDVKFAGVPSNPASKSSKSRRDVFSSRVRISSMKVLGSPITSPWPE